MNLWERVRGLTLSVTEMRLSELRLDTRSGWQRQCLVIELHGPDGSVGRGEDVTYEFSDPTAFLAEFPPAEITAAASLAALLDRCARTPRHVLSMGLGSPPSTAVLHAWRALEDPRFKLDADPSWSDELIAELHALARVDVVDLKGYYAGTPVDTPADPDFYRRVIEGMPDALIEDPLVNASTLPLLQEHRARISWDAPIHRVADLEALPWIPAWINIKPSRFASLRELSAAYAWCAEHGVRSYGGGQFELGPGRRQIRTLAGLFHPDAPNDVAPAHYHRADPLDPTTLS